jgi:hypothetical protein
MLIQLELGVDGIAFGMSEAQLVKLLGEPSKVYLDDNESRDLAYYRLKLVLKIEPNGRLGWIEVHNREAVWNGINPWTTDQATLLKLLSQHLGEPHELDDYGRMESYCFPESWVELQYEVGQLTIFNFGVRYGENDEPIYPDP